MSLRATFAQDITKRKDSAIPPPQHRLLLNLARLILLENRKGAFTRAELPEFCLLFLRFDSAGGKIGIITLRYGEFGNHAATAAAHANLYIQ